MYRLRTHLPWFSASAGELSTLAMLSYPVVKRHAATIWEATKHGGGITCAYERLVLGSVGVDKAVSRQKAADTKVEWDNYTLIGVVACALALERTKAHLESMFVESVGLASLDSASANDKEDDLRGITVDAARSLGGRMAELGGVFGKVWRRGGSRTPGGSGSDGVKHDVVLGFDWFCAIASNPDVLSSGFQSSRKDAPCVITQLSSI
ncbi:hypothetical protein EV421DRAFT_347615 [Armillaria borealis]|uniref:Uncharacterized protein n=1 Tax=Armillaria borealis TaxID=47425 RepID=A0AA39JRG0_9AGAR|nr:hypothetical protein EV421DRAFT_347615 [Armillaria borealis]